MAHGNPSPHSHNATAPTGEVSVGMLADFGKATGEPLRLLILRVLKTESLGVQELAQLFSIAQPGMSHHLKVLLRAGLVETRRQGNSIFYRRALLPRHHSVASFLEALYRAVDEVELPSDAASRLRKIYLQRAKRSQQYFAKNVDKFAENQGLLCEPAGYLPNLEALVSRTPLPRTARVLEVGPGRGHLLSFLAGRFESVVALDNSKEMLEYTKQQVGRKASKISFVHQAFEAFRPKRGAFDAIFLDMSLHHMVSPREAFLHACSLLGEGGYLFVSDLSSHHQEWVRESCGDVWLGFTPEELATWATQADFSTSQRLFLGLKNGFQIQIWLFAKNSQKHSQKENTHGKPRLQDR